MTSTVPGQDIGNNVGVRHGPAPLKQATTVVHAVVHTVVQQHVEESAMLRHVRSVLVRAPHVGLLQLGRLDERLAAHLDGVAVAGEHGTRLCLAALERVGCGEVFALTVRALELRDASLTDRVIALAQALPDAMRGVVSALGWVSATDLQGVARLLLASDDPTRRALGLDACRMHQVDPGLALLEGLASKHAATQAAALRAAGELGRLDLLPQVQQAMSNDDAVVAFRAAQAACLLGDRDRSLQRLRDVAMDPTVLGDHALSCLMAACSDGMAGEVARVFSQRAQAEPDSPLLQRRLIRVIGMLGTAHHVPWLVERMAQPPLARIAGEAFSWMTGADLARMDLETLQAPALPEHPTDDPNDNDVSLDDDESLPWPNAAKVQAWWAQQTAMHAAASAGARLFEGERPNAAAARRVLVHGTQRRRARAALLACALQPGVKRFPIAAPARRQQRWLTGTH